MLRVVLTAVLLVSFAGCRTEPPEEKSMSIEKLRTMLKAGDYDTPAVARSVGQAAVPVLIEHLSDPDPQVRLIAVNSLAEVDSPATVAGFARALEDAYRPVRTSAKNTLWNRHDASILPTLHKGLTSNPYPDARSAIALIIGLIGQAGSLRELQDAFHKERDPAVQGDIQLAMARLGDVPMQDTVATRLFHPETEKLLKAFQDITYVNNRRLGYRLYPFLQDRRPAYKVGRSSSLRDARICDAVINAASEIYGRPFSFEVSRHKIYSHEQIKEAAIFFQTMQR